MTSRERDVDFARSNNAFCLTEPLEVPRVNDISAMPDVSVETNRYNLIQPRSDRRLTRYRGYEIGKVVRLYDGFRTIKPFENRFENWAENHPIATAIGPIFSTLKRTVSRRSAFNRFCKSAEETCCVKEALLSDRAADIVHKRFDVFSVFFKRLRIRNIRSIASMPRDIGYYR